jgi:CspA family cold shock protein
LSKSTREVGKVKWFDATRNFGFISRENGPDVFIHGSAIAGTSYRRLEVGDAVEFEVEEGARGLRAVNVVSLTSEANCQ